MNTSNFAGIAKLAKFKVFVYIKGTSLEIPKDDKISASFGIEIISTKRFVTKTNQNPRHISTVLQMNIVWWFHTTKYHYVKV